jgi:hypothetical protein
MGKVHLAAHESMQPTSVHRVGRTEQMHVALIIASADEDHCPLEGDVEVEREAFGKHVAVWGAFPFGGGLGPVGGYIAMGEGHQACDVGAVVPLPDLALPKGVEAFNGVLKARLARWGEHGNDFQSQTQAADATYGIGELMCPLEDRIVVELEFPPFRGRFTAWDSSRALRWLRVQCWTYPPLVVDG